MHSFVPKDNSKYLPGTQELHFGCPRREFVVPAVDGSRSRKAVVGKEGNKGRLKMMTENERRSRSRRRKNQ